jgi:hypothetical protein
MSALWSFETQQQQNKTSQRIHDPKPRASPAREIGACGDNFHAFHAMMGNSLLLSVYPGRVLWRLSLLLCP